MPDTRSDADQSFSREFRLRGRLNFEEVFKGKSSKRHKGRFCFVSAAVSAEPGTRFGLSISRKAGNAVRRNRLKRIIREFLRKNKSAWPENKMIVISIARPVDDEDGLLKEIEDILINQ